jgi:thymidylate synthase
MKSYQKVLKKIIAKGVEKESGRANMPNTIGISHAVIKMDLQKGFPLLTTKKMHWKGIIHELLWFLRGETNIKYLIDNNCNIWNSDAYRWYLKYVGTMVEPDYDYLMDDPIENKTRPFTSEEFVERIKLNQLGDDLSYKLGDLGKVYGYQWRNQNGVDQVAEVLDGLKNNPYSRYHIIDAWNKAEFKEMALPPCHLLYQFIVRPISIEKRVKMYYDNGEMVHVILGNAVYDIDSTYTSENDIHGDNCPDPIGIEYSKENIEYLDKQNIPKFYLDLNMYQRSADSALGIPFNLASMSLLLMLFAKANNMIAGISTWIGGDTHLYVNHVETAKEQLTRTPLGLPEMKINKELNNLDDILSLDINDFELVGYESYPKINYELFVGLAK